MARIKDDEIKTMYFQVYSFVCHDLHGRKINIGVTCSHGRKVFIRWINHASDIKKTRSNTLLSTMAAILGLLLLYFFRSNKIIKDFFYLFL